jgi:RNA methyltransferase, TrmH family
MCMDHTIYETVNILPAMSQTSPHNPLSSKENSTIKHLHALSDPKTRKRERAFLIEGTKMVEEALRDNRGVAMVVASPTIMQHHGKGILKLAEHQSVELVWISERLMDTISESKTPQPVMAVVKMREYSEEELLAHSAKLIIVAHRLQDPGNLGTIIRTAEAVGASGMAITPNTVDPFNAKAVRASMGSLLRLPIVPVGDVARFIKKCKQRGFQTVATVVTGKKKHFDIDLTKPTVMILGQEGAGLSQDMLADIDLQVRIPMAETIDSLNVATAAAIILYEAVRQRLSH